MTRSHEEDVRVQSKPTERHTLPTQAQSNPTNDNHYIRLSVVCIQCSL